MQLVSSRIWTRVTVSLSYDDNNYTTGTSSSWWTKNIKAKKQKNKKQNKTKKRKEKENDKGCKKNIV